MTFLEPLLNSGIENVYIYVADAVRDDYLPDNISNSGVRTTSIAGGIHSPTSFATIVSGTYIPTHGVADFTDKLASGVPNVLKTTSHKTAFVNTINHSPFNDNPDSESIITKTLDTTDSPSNSVETLSPPFLAIERGRGGHAPYGEFDGNGSEYFRDRGAASRATFANEYQEGVQVDTEWFLSQLNKLDERDLLDKTLVIYTSDHGELLGEMGMLGHNGPIHRRLVETPCVFIHPSLNTKSIGDEIVRQVDIVPTISSVAGVEFDHRTAVQGVDLTKRTPASLGASFYEKSALKNKKYSPTIRLSYESVWDASGGYVFRNSRYYTRLAEWSYSMIRGPQQAFRRAHMLEVLRSFLTGTRVMGTPQFTSESAAEYLDQISNGHDTDNPDEDIDVPKERLRELGYVE